MRNRKSLIQRIKSLSSKTKAIDWTEGMYGNKPREESSIEGIHPLHPKPAPPPPPVEPEELDEPEAPKQPKTPAKLTPPKVKPGKISGEGETPKFPYEDAPVDVPHKLAARLLDMNEGDVEAALDALRAGRVAIGKQNFTGTSRAIEQALIDFQELGLPPDTHPEIVGDRREELGLSRYNFEVNNDVIIKALKDAWKSGYRIWHRTNQRPPTPEDRREFMQNNFSRRMLSERGSRQEERGAIWYAWAAMSPDEQDTLLEAAFPDYLPD